MKRFLRKRFNYKICERFAQTFLQRVPKPFDLIGILAGRAIVPTFWDGTLYRIYVSYRLNFKPSS
ncbi:hypothetical protein LEP1GSC016_3422 [Leptospira borgpetersenii serovar Hardjo-bovis str. Sponselee]|uniref:Uncharacterized protein n=1 Tax=Leptospira borgpetersenii serovar Hardjo-bovis str. Sponselee TaxID=1303729 RepID=M6BJQ9_LEPBO|nr:hypothetical protein LBK9_02850 [Leptospira borgpetersenii serovar Hardjo]AWV69264.1 hypothetical protein B9T54_03110 [Leptospira borgpetersenii serovar Hardjo-bovis]EMJ78796.1 hypothetical protein LEP1GSC016_3422 [Leptospira borgpetersenii serovar Hardjo-bovis str. Sponselee]TQE53368.1 hypothetical protein FFZ95_07640 [Leptospira borgpetersenii]AMX63839.1 hypothetical protein LBK30_02905 [Leptospira borgpetersenii serovar Hardjo]